MTSEMEEAREHAVQYVLSDDENNNSGTAFGTQNDIPRTDVVHGDNTLVGRAPANTAAVIETEDVATGEKEVHESASLAKRLDEEDNDNGENNTKIGKSSDQKLTKIDKSMATAVEKRESIKSLSTSTTTKLPQESKTTVGKDKVSAKQFNNNVGGDAKGHAQRDKDQILQLQNQKALVNGTTLAAVADDNTRQESFLTNTTHVETTRLDRHDGGRIAVPGAYAYSTTVVPDSTGNVAIVVQERRSANNLPINSMDFTHDVSFRVDDDPDPEQATTQPPPQSSSIAAGNNHNNSNGTMMVSASLVRDMPTVEAEQFDEKKLLCGSRKNQKFVLLLGLLTTIVVIVLSIVVTEIAQKKNYALPEIIPFPEPLYPTIDFNVDGGVTYEQTIQNLVVSYATEESIHTIFGVPRRNQTINDAATTEDGQASSQLTFDNSTIDPLSSSYRAYEWLKDDTYLQTMFINQDDVYGNFTERVLQRYALAAQYYNFNGEYWRFTTGWLNHTLDECWWFSGRIDGVATCNQTSNLYYGLELPFNNVTGSIHQDVHLLRSLVFYNLEVNSVTGTIPTTLGLLHSSLSFFVAPENKLTGTIPSEFGMLTRLEEWAINDNDIGGTLPPEIGNEGMEKLLFMIFQNNPKLSGTIPESYGMLSNLEAVWLSGTNVTGTMPEQICHIAQNVHYLDVTVDCKEPTGDASDNDPSEEIQCDCCSCFGAPRFEEEASGEEEEEDEEGSV